MAETSRVIALWSPVAGTGTTFTACALASSLADLNLRVCLLDFDLKSPTVSYYFQLQNGQHNLDAVLPFVAEGHLQKDALELNLQKVQGIQVLCGTRRPDQAPYFAPDALRPIVDAARDAFDVVLVDTNPDFFDCAGTYVAIEQADATLVVMVPNVIAGFAYADKQALFPKTFDRSRFALVVNQVEKDVYMETRQLQELVGAQTAFELPRLNSDFLNALNQGKWLEHIQRSAKAAGYADAIKKLAAHLAGVEVEEKPAPKRFSFALFRGRDSA